MLRSTEKVFCPKCQKTIRPSFKMCTEKHLVCPHCREHQDGATGSGVDSNSCRDQELPIPLVLNKIFKTSLDKCQYDCGFKANLLELEEHERTCYRHDKLVKCAIANCQWHSVLSKIVQHFETDHPSCLMDLSNTGEEFIIAFDNPVALFAQYDKKNIDNELYWLRVHEHAGDRYIMLLHQGRTRPNVEEDSRAREYLISPVSNEDLSMKVRIIYNTGDDDITDNHFMLMKGTRILLDGDSYVIKVNNPAAGIILESMLKDLECYVCTEMMCAPIRICSRGHSTCGVCAGKLEKCPKCQGRITENRNYSLEQVAMNVMDKMKNRTQKNVGVARTDDRMATKCVNGACYWKGTYRDMLKHWQEKHPQCIKSNVESFTDDNSSSHYLFHVSGNNFVLMSMSERNNNYYFLVHHVTPQKKTHFNFDLELSNPETGFIRRYSGPCLASTGSDVRQHEYLESVGNELKISMEEFDEEIRDTNGYFTTTLNIYPP